MSQQPIQPEQLYEDHILIVEDDRDIARLLKFHLQELGTTVTILHDGQSALEYLKSEAYVDIVLLDIGMKSMDGFEVCAKIQEMPGADAIPIVFLTAADRIEHQVRAFSCGGVDYIIKPVVPEVLQGRVSAVLKTRRLMKQLMFERSTDTLTGLCNRNEFMRQLDYFVQRHLDNMDYQFALYFVDLDNFKQFNDKYGHEVGDKVLIHTARRLTHAVRTAERVKDGSCDIVARLAGDEFVIIADDIPNHTVAGVIAQRILDQFNRKLELNDMDLEVSISVGVRMIGHDELVDLQKVLNESDQAMYSAKRAGKGQYVIFE